MTERADRIVSTLTDAFADLMAANPTAFRAKFRTMARDPFAFYRGSACLFYADVTDDGPFADVDQTWVGVEGARRIWIQGDLHAENFGTYLDAGGRLVFDVNDFDEAYVGHWTWDVYRFCGSLGLLGWQKALPDDAIDDLVATYVRAYVDWVHHYVDAEDDTDWALTLASARGGVLDALRRARLHTRLDLLDHTTVVADYNRRFADRSGIRRLDDSERDRVEAAFTAYLETVPETKKEGVVMFDVLDVVGREGQGVGSAGLPTYLVLIEGFSQALDNDVVLSVKQGNVAAPSRVVRDQDVASFFLHHGHRTALSQRALQAHADRFLGWTVLPSKGDDPLGPPPRAQRHTGAREPAGPEGTSTGFVVTEQSPYEADLEWAPLDEPDEMREVVEQLGQATAKIHCVDDHDAEHDLVRVSVEQVISDCVGDDVDGLVRNLSEFAHRYAEQVRSDHAEFVDAFRGGAFAEVTPA